MARVAIVGGGISGLAAAWFLRQALGTTAELVVYDKKNEIGGHLRTGEVAGLPVDLGAESLLARRPEAVELVTAVGLGDRLVHPAPVGATIWSRGRMWPLPDNTVMGVPDDPRPLLGLLTAAEIERAGADRTGAGMPIADDVAIGALVERRFGRAVVDRLVEPLLGGVYAGHADELSLDATVPALGRAAREHSTLGAAVAAVRSSARCESADRPSGQAPADERAPVDRRGAHTEAGHRRIPVFAGIDGGVGQLPAAVARAASAQLRTGTTVRELRRMPTGWHLVTGPAPAPTIEDADAVVLALPASPTARLLAGVATVAAVELAEVDAASMAIVAMAVPRSAFGAPPTTSGFLVPPVEGRAVKAVTYSSVKWPWLADRAGDLVVLRASIGRHREVADLQRDDDELVDIAVRDLRDAVGLVGPPIDARVMRWGGALPQYAIGHVDRVARVRAAVARVSGLAVCGATYDGVGIAACVGGAQAAAEQVAAHLHGAADRRARIEA